MGQMFERLPDSPILQNGVPFMPAPPPVPALTPAIGQAINPAMVPPQIKIFNVPTGIRDDRQLVTTYEVVDWDDVPESMRNHLQVKAEAAAAVVRANLAKARATRKKIGFVDKKKTTCMLYLQADHLFHEQMGSEEASIEAMTRHVQRVNSIYQPIGKFMHIHIYISLTFINKYACLPY